MNKYQAKGFTLMEVMLSLALLAVLGFISAPFFQSFQVRNDLDIAVEQTVSALRQAQLLAQSGVEDSAWSLQISNGMMIVYRGNNFADRDPQWDYPYTIPSDITVSGDNSVIFNPLTGFISSAGTINMLSSGLENRTISINKKGMVTY